MVLSKTCNHAIRATLYVAMYPERNFLPIREIAEKLGISFHFLTKILQQLTQNNIMTSFKGPNGGVALARAADQIFIKEIIIAIDGEKLFSGCMVGLDHCGDEKPCPLHDDWAIIRDQLENLFRHTSVARLSERIRSEGLRLSNFEMI